MLIGVISDTHIPRRRKSLPTFVLDTFKRVDLILHAGDINDFSVLKALNRIAPTEAIAGNTDPAGLVQALGRKKLLTLCGYKVGLTHGYLGKGISTPLRAYNTFPGADIIVFGHSHQPLEKWYKGCLLFNPGSPTDRRNEPKYSLGILELGETIESKLLYFDP